MQAAFDNSPVTRWRTQQQSKPGDYIEVDFGQDQAVDQVDVETSADHWATRIRLLGSADGSSWKPLAGMPEDLDLPPQRFARRMATLEMAARGVHYLLVEPSDYGARDILDDPGFWGLKEIGQTGEVRLYHIEPAPPAKAK